MTITDSPSAKLVAVTGATGLQGGSVINVLKRSAMEYRIRGFTRNASSAKPSDLKTMGVEVVELDLSAKNQKDIQKAVEGADVVFGMTNFWEHLNDKKEMADGKALVQASVDAKVPLFVWAGLPSCKKVSKGKYIHRGDELVNGKPSIPYALPIAGKVALIDITDLGLWVQAVIEHPELQEEDVPAAVVELTGQEQADLVTKYSSVNLSFTLDEATYKSFLPPPVATELIEFWNTVDYGGAEFQKVHKYLEFPPKTFAEWAKAAKFPGPRSS